MQKIIWWGLMFAVWVGTRVKIACLSSCFLYSIECFICVELSIVCFLQILKECMYNTICLINSENFGRARGYKGGGGRMPPVPPP